MSLEPCPICGGDSKLLFAGTVDASEYFRAHEYRIANNDSATLETCCCTQCGHGWSPVCADTNIDAWYASAPSDTAYLAETLGRRRAAAGVLKVVEQYVHSGVLLDIGCGPGLLLAEARKRGWSVAGVEPSRWAVDASSRFGVAAAITHGTIDVLSDVPPASADAVTAIDVIEHVRDPHTLVRHCSTIVRRGGVLAIVTPDIGSILARVLGRRWYCIHPAHLHYFTARSLAALLRQYGFRVVHSGHYVRWFSPEYLLARMIKKPLGRTRMPPIPLPLLDTLALIALRE